MSKTFARLLVACLAVVLIGAACSDDEKSDAGTSSKSATESAAPVDYDALGLWDDGPCDTAKPKLKIGLMTVFESPGISLKDQATALEASAEAFNQRGGANGACVEVHTCDDGANAEKAVACVREIDNAGVVATVNDQGTAGQADVAAATTAANIPRVANNVTPGDWAMANSYPIDAAGTGVTVLQPQALIDQNKKKIGLARVGLAEANAISGILTQIYADQGAEFVFDGPVTAGTTDYNQFILGAQDAGADGLSVSLDEQGAVQVIKAGQQLDTDLTIATSLGSFPHSAVGDLGDFANQMTFMWSYPPATVDVPVYKVLRADLAASGDDQLQTENLKASPMRSWIGLYALIKLIRDNNMTDFTREGITAMLNQAKDVPMLGLFGGENWTPAKDHAGLIKRAGINHYASYTWDPDAEFDGSAGNFVEKSTMNFDEVLCGSPLGAPPPC